MKKEEIIEDKVLDAIEGTTTTKTHKMKRTKLMIKGVPVTTIVLSIGALLVIGALIVTINPFSLTVDDEIELGGGVSAFFYYDDVSLDIEQPTQAIAPDVFTDGVLNAGETETFTHKINSATDNGDYDVTFDTSFLDAWISDPDHEFYGYTFEVQNMDGSPIDVPFTILGSHGAEGKSFKMVHNLHSDFVAVENLLPFGLIMDVVEHINSAPTAVDDDGGSAATKDIDVLANDVDIETPNALEITEVTKVGDWSSWGGSISIIGTYPTQQVHYSQSGSPGVVFSFTYTIADPDGLTDIATVTMDGT